MFKKVYKVIATILTVASIIGLAWFCISYAEVCCKNLTTAPTYSSWNLFQLLVNMGQETIPFFTFSVGSARLPTLAHPNRLKVGNIWKWQILLKLEDIPFLKLPHMERFFASVAGSWGDRFSRYLQFCHFLAFISWHGSCIGAFLKLPLY